VISSTFAFQNGKANKVLIFKELILVDTFSYPRSEHFTDLKEGMKIAGVDGSCWFAADCPGLDHREGGTTHLLLDSALHTVIFVIVHRYLR
jgi:hypothetical protein